MNNKILYPNNKNFNYILYFTKLEYLIKIFNFTSNKNNYVRRERRSKTPKKLF